MQSTMDTSREKHTYKRELEEWDNFFSKRINIVGNKNRIKNQILWAIWFGFVCWYVWFLYLVASSSGWLRFSLYFCLIGSFFWFPYLINCTSFYWWFFWLMHFSLLILLMDCIFPIDLYDWLRFSLLEWF